MSALDRIYAAAAEARAEGVRGHGDRPSQRRCAEHSESPNAARVRADRMEIRASSTADGALHFTGYASVYDKAYEMWDMFGPYTEQTMAGAGKESLANPELDVPLVLAHDSLRRIARTVNGTLTLTEDEHGLLVDAPALDAKDADVAYIAPKLQTGLIDEMSFRFTITAGSWSPDWDEYHLEAYDIHRGDVAIVGYGANPYTAGAGLRAPRLDDMTEARLRALEKVLHRTRSAMTLADLDRLERNALIA